RVIVFAAIERLAIAIQAREWIDGFRRIVGVNARLCRDGTFQPVAVEEGAVTCQRGDAPAVNRFAGMGDGLLDLAVALLHAQADFQLLLQREVLEVESLARSDADARKLGAYLLLVFLSGRELQREV